MVPYMNYEDMPADIRTFENTNSMKDIFTDTVNMLTDFTSNIDVVGSLTETINTHFESLKEMQNLSAKTPVQRPMREVMPRMPWHDIHACVSSMAAKDLAAHFVQVDEVQLFVSPRIVTFNVALALESPSAVQERTLSPHPDGRHGQSLLFHVCKVRHGWYHRSRSRVSQVWTIAGAREREFELQGED